MVTFAFAWFLPSQIQNVCSKNEVALTWKLEIEKQTSLCKKVVPVAFLHPHYLYCLAPSKDDTVDSLLALPVAKQMSRENVC